MSGKYECPHCGRNLNDPRLFRDTIFYNVPDTDGPGSHNVTRIQCVCGVWLREESGNAWCKITDWEEK